MVTVSSITSRVVPWISETMALSSPSRAFSKVDFPTLGGPIIATGTPFLMAFPSSKELASRAISSLISLVRAASFCLSANSTSSSEKSNSSSSKDVISRSLSLSSPSLPETLPRICLMAIRCCDSVCEAMRSATASACMRSSLPFRNARLVYSPGSAMEHPSEMSSDNIFWITYDEP